MRSNVSVTAFTAVLLCCFCLSADASSYKNSLVRYVYRQKNKIPRRRDTAPADTQIQLFREAVYHLLLKEYAGADQTAGFLGYTLKELTHTNGLNYYIFESGNASRRPWGTYIFYQGDDKKKLVIEVPHPVTEKNTSIIGIKAFIDSKAAAFLLSGTRKGGGKGSDVTLNPDCMFQAVHKEMGDTTGYVIIQIHGFNNRKYPDIVLTSGSPVAIAAMDDLIDTLITEGFTVGIYNGMQFEDYASTQNEQAKYYNSIGGSFIAMFLNRAVHHSRAKNSKVINAIEEYTVSETTLADTSAI